MRIDDEKKVVYVDELLFDEITKLKEGIGIVGVVSLFQILWEYQNDYPEIQKFLWSYEKDIWTSDEEPLIEDDKNNQILMVKIWSDDYTFKLEQPKKYYWRKKKEHLAWFEDVEETYLNVYFSEVYLGVFRDSDNCEFTETEARDLLKDDFDKFEKVECE